MFLVRNYRNTASDDREFHMCLYIIIYLSLKTALFTKRNDNPYEVFLNGINRSRFAETRNNLQLSDCLDQLCLSVLKLETCCIFQTLLLLFKARDLRKLSSTKIQDCERLDTDGKRADYGKRQAKETRQECHNLPRQSVVTMEENREV